MFPSYELPGTSVRSLMCNTLIFVRSAPYVCVCIYINRPRAGFSRQVNVAAGRYVDTPLLRRVSRERVLERDRARPRDYTSVAQPDSGSVSARNTFKPIGRILHIRAVVLSYGESLLQQRCTRETRRRDPARADETEKGTRNESETHRSPRRSAKRCDNSQSRDNSDKSRLSDHVALLDV